MAASSALLFSTNDLLCYTVIKSADADASLAIVFPPGSWAGGAAPPGANLVAIPVAILQAPAALSQAAVTTQANTGLTLTFGTGAGSGNAGAQYQVYVFRKR